MNGMVVSYFCFELTNAAIFLSVVLGVRLLYRMGRRGRWSDWH